MHGTKPKEKTAKTPKVLSPMTDSTGKRDYAPRRSCSVQDSTATRMERLDYKLERQVSTPEKLVNKSATWGNILERKVTPLVKLGNTLERMATCE